MKKEPVAHTLRYLALLFYCLWLPACQPSRDGGSRIDYSPSPSPDGTRIAFVSERNGSKGLFLINVDGSAETRILSGADTPAWSPDGSRIAFCAKWEGNEDVYVMKVDGWSHVNLTNHPADECDPGWSPDGQKILFNSNRDGDWRNRRDDNWEIYIMDADGSDQTRLIATPGYDLTTGQAWSPDGTKIVFCSTMNRKFIQGPNQYDDFDLYIMNADGSDIKQLTFTAGQDSYAFWSPDGETISFTHVDEGAPRGEHGGQDYEIDTIRPDGTDLKRLTDNPGFDFGGWWFPDSTRMVYTSSTDTQAIHIMNADGTKKVRLTNRIQSSGSR